MRYVLVGKLPPNAGLNRMACQEVTLCETLDAVQIRKDPPNNDLKLYNLRTLGCLQSWSAGAGCNTNKFKIF